MRKTRKIILITLASVFFTAGCFMLIAYAHTWGKTDLEFSIHINEKIIMQSVYGESPTFAIWIENPETGATQTIFVTSRAGLNDWEGKAEVPAALPKWFEISKVEEQAKNQSGQKKPGIDAITGATPKPGIFTTRIRVKPGSTWICWIEMNLSGDYNDHYKEYNDVDKTIDKYGTGQPAIVYRTEVKAVEGNTVVPK